MIRTRLLAALLLTGCATGAPVGGQRAAAAVRTSPFGPPALQRSTPTLRDGAPLKDLPPGSRERAVELAQGQVGKTQVRFAGKRFPDDCTGLVKGIFEQLGVDLLAEARPGDNGVLAIYRFAGAHGRVYEGGRPVAGDLVFFRETYDLNRDGRVNDGLTHVGLVESVQEDSTVWVIHRVNRGVVRYRMNLAHPLAKRDPGTGAQINDALRLPGRGPEILTAQLFAGYATLLPIERRVASAR